MKRNPASVEWATLNHFLIIIAVLISVSASAGPKGAGKIVSIETWSDPQVPFVTPYKIERLSDGSFISLGWGKFSAREEFWLVKKADLTARNFQEVDRLPFEKGLQKHARAVTEVRLRARDSRVVTQRRSAQELYVTGLDAELSSQGVIYFALVRKSIDGAKTWKTVDRYRMGTLAFTGTTDIASDKMGNVAYVGHGCDSIDEAKLNFCRWFVRYSKDGGLTWVNVDELSSPELPFWEPQKIRIDSRGRVVVVGFYSSSKPSKVRWAVTRLFDPLGRKWVNVDLLGPQGPQSSNWDMIVLPTGEILTSGSSIVDGRLNWLVRKSDGLGKNWRTIDGHICPTGLGVSRAFPIAVFHQAIFVAGYAKCEGEAKNRLIVRRSVDGGATWKTMLDQEEPGGFFSVSDIVALGYKDVVLTARHVGNPSGAVIRAELSSAR